MAQLYGEDFVRAVKAILTYVQARSVPDNFAQACRVWTAYGRMGAIVGRPGGMAM